MPIRPENRKRYPSDWKHISLRIRNERAGGQCECEGECRSDPHGTWWRRLVAMDLEPSMRCPNRNGMASHFGQGSRVVLTVAHLNHTPEDCRPENLKAMCQSCHLNYDREHHAETRRITDARKRAEQDAAWLQSVREALPEVDEETLRILALGGDH